jgi:PleD family two-component response regulator
VIQEAVIPQSNNILDITGDPVILDAGRVEVDQEMEKMNKVIALIKSLDSPVDRIQMVQQLQDTFQTKPVKTKKLIDAGKEVFQEWLAEEIGKFPEKVDILLIESILSIMDKATWTVDDVCRLRIDKTLRVLYKACCSTDKLTSTEYSNIMNQAKKMWPRYRNMFKNVAKI